MKKLDLAYKVSIITIIINILLCIFKLITGLISKSQIMISDAIHSASDVASTFIVIIGIFVSRKESDREHPYGHEKYESIAGFVLSLMLAAVGYNLLKTSVLEIVHQNYTATTSSLALFAAIISILVKEGMYQYTIKAAKKINSTALKADAWHHRSDALSSVGAVLGIAGSLLGYHFLEPITVIVISYFIFKSAWDILKDAISKLIDTSADDNTLNKITKLIEEEEDILHIDSLKTRLFGSKIYVDLEIAVDENLSLKSSHEIAEKIHLKIEKYITNCKHCMVHVNPYQKN